MKNDDWLRARNWDGKGYRLGGSDAAAAAGWSQWRSRYQLYEDLMNGGRRVDDDEDNDVLLMGREMELAILRAYAKKTGRAVFRVVDGKQLASATDDWPNSVPYEEMNAWLRRQRQVHHDPLVIHDTTHSWISRSLDAVVWDQSFGWGVVDAKNQALHKRAEWHVDGEVAVPPEYTAQIAHYTFDGPFGWGGFATLFGGQHLGVFDIRRDELDRVNAQLMPLEADFVRRLAEKDPPPIEPTAGERDTLAALFGQRAFPKPTVGWASNYDTANETFDPETFDEEYVDAIEQSRAAYNRRKQLEAVILAVAEGSHTVMMPDRTTYRIGSDGNGQRVRIYRKAAKNER